MNSRRQLCTEVDLLTIQPIRDEAVIPTDLSESIQIVLNSTFLPRSYLLLSDDPADNGARRSRRHLFTLVQKKPRLKLSEKTNDGSLFHSLIIRIIKVEPKMFSANRRNTDEVRIVLSVRLLYSIPAIMPSSRPHRGVSCRVWDVNAKRQNTTRFT